MHVSATLPSFFSENTSEISKLIASVSKGLNYQGPQNDVKHDLYLRMHHLSVLEKYNKDRAKISTLLWTIIRNLIMKNMMEENKYKYNVLPISEKVPDDVDDIDYLIQNDCTNLDYQSMIERNQDSDRIESRAAELRDFISSLSNSSKNKKHKCSRRKDKSIDTEGYDLVEIFNNLYLGFSSHEIAAKHGVTDMTISHTKDQMAKLLKDYGIELPAKSEKIEENMFDDEGFYLDEESI
jgi:hypothetical protein